MSGRAHRGIIVIRITQWGGGGGGCSCTHPASLLEVDQPALRRNTKSTLSDPEHHIPAAAYTNSVRWATPKMGRQNSTHTHGNLERRLHTDRLSDLQSCVNSHTHTHALKCRKMHTAANRHTHTHSQQVWGELLFLPPRGPAGPCPTWSGR